MAIKYVEKKGRVFVPTKKARELSLAGQDVYKKAAANRVKFWEELAREGIDWIEPWHTAYEQKGLKFGWFKGGKLNLCYNAVDRHLDRPDKTAIVFVPEDPQEQVLRVSYFELFKQVNKAAALLKQKGVKKGDVVAVYMPMIPEALVFMLACARIGAIHSVVFSAFSPDALRTRIKDGGAKVLITTNYYYRKGKKINLLKQANKACRFIKIKKLIVDRKKVGKTFEKMHDVIVKPESMESEDTAFLLYTSGTTGKPKGVMHAVGGYTTQAYWSCRYVFNLQENETMWCTADVGWITGHTYACYGPLLNGATTVIYEGLPNYPKPDRYLKIIEKEEVNVFYTAPTALRMFALAGTEYTRKYKMDSLKILGSVGEPIDEATWMWFYKNIGKNRCPVIDTYWQTETGSAVIMSLPGIGPFIPTYAAIPFPGMDFDVINEKGKKVPAGKEGLLIQRPPFSPSLIRGVWKNEKRYKNYFDKNGDYTAGDGAIKNAKGWFRILGRSDDIIKVAGHRMSTAEIEDAIASLRGVVEAVIVGREDKLRGMVPVAFVKAKAGLSEEDVIARVVKRIGPIAKPAEVYFVEDIPKTRSGKMMRRILKTLLAGEDVKNVSTLINPGSVKAIGEMIKDRAKRKARCGEDWEMILEREKSNGKEK
ncbi:MAG: acetate--CoA ligase [Nanoarchaeota archaeon]|nr:acetate--CoA ligase [Nanoarchaeota archaeon]MBU1051909.1 acetate--CoA ligase [Nanoarchaeota archaeon]MBU1988952.1 acetate--CoA ligase [Nanoarchaeota archaeon]